MTRIKVVSRSWPVHERSGVSLAAAQHVRLLAENHEISIIGANEAILREDLPVVSRIHVPAEGSGALYSPARVDLVALQHAIAKDSPDLVVVEAWQTAITDATVEATFRLGIPVLMVSHGSSLHAFTRRPKDILRALAWYHYRRRILPRLISRLSALTTLDQDSSSRRFYDRDVARRLNVPVVPLVNTPAHQEAHFLERERRKRQVLVVGYYSPIKNQLAALEIAARLQGGIQFLFVGETAGPYFEACVSRSRALGLQDAVRFMSDRDCDLPAEIARSMVVLSTSITEALPITLIESMAAGTPFVATPVGAVPSLQGGVHASQLTDQVDAVTALLRDAGRWNELSRAGRSQFAERFTRETVRHQLNAAVAVALIGSARSESTVPIARSGAKQSDKQARWEA